MTPNPTPPLSPAISQALTRCGVANVCTWEVELLAAVDRARVAAEGARGIIEVKSQLDSFFKLGLPCAARWLDGRRHKHRHTASLQRWDWHLDRTDHRSFFGAAFTLQDDIDPNRALKTGAARHDSRSDAVSASINELTEQARET